MDRDAAANIARHTSARMITNISDNKRRVTARLIARAVREGWNDDELAERVKDVVGLTERDMIAVENFRKSKAMMELPPGMRRVRAREYANRLREHRAGVIARHELKSAGAAAKRFQLIQDVETGQVPPGAKVMSVALNGCCEQCRNQHGKVRDIDVLKGPPWHTNCRCHDEMIIVPGLVVKAEPRDGDGDGKVYDGTLQERRVFHFHDPARKLGEFDYDLQAVPMNPDDLPPVVYHVTTAMKQIRRTGYLRAGLGAGGLGGRDAGAVSLTVDKDIADRIEKDLMIMHRSAVAWQGGAPEFHAWLDATVKDEGWSLRKSFNDAQWELMSRNYNFADWMNTYFNYRSSATGIRNPLFFGAKPEHWAAIDPANIGMVKVPRYQIKATGAAVGDFDLHKDYGLKEVRVFGDIDLTRKATP